LEIEIETQKFSIWTSVSEVYASPNLGEFAPRAGPAEIGMMSTVGGPFKPSFGLVRQFYR
jgi:hypothetical protein